MMKATLEVNLQRLVSIIDIVTLHKAVDISELADYVGASKKTLLNDIKDFNENYPPFKLEASPHYYRLTHPVNFSIRELYQMILNNSSSVEFIWSILLKEYSLDEYAEVNFTSSSNIRRLIKRFNDTFAEKNLPLEVVTKPFLHIAGEENLIRQLYQHLVTERYGIDFLTEFPGLPEIYTEIQHLVIRNFPNDKDIVDCYSVVLLIFIAAKRQNQAFYTTHSAKHKIKAYTLAITALFKKSTLLDSLLWDHLQFKVKISSVADILPFDSPSIIPTMYLKHKPDYYINKNLGITYADVLEFTTDFFKAIDLEVEQITPPTIWLYNVMAAQQRFPFYIFNRYYFFKNHLNKTKPTTVTTFFEHCEQSKLFDQSIQTDDLRNELFYHIIMATPEFSNRLLSVIEPKKVIFLSTFSTLLYFRLQYITAKKYPQLSDVDIYHGSLTNLDYELLDKYDVIVTDMPLVDSPIIDKVIRFSFNDVANFWKDFETLIT